MVRENSRWVRDPLERCALTPRSRAQNWPPRTPFAPRRSGAPASLLHEAGQPLLQDAPEVTGGVELAEDADRPDRHAVDQQVCRRQVELPAQPARLVARIGDP